jgi:signal transduction histidine kinase
MTLSRRITIAAVILSCVTIINGYVTYQYIRKVNSNILQVLDIEEPLEEALLEMEISTGSTAEAVLNYIQDYQQDHINTTQDSKSDFDVQIAAFLARAERPQEQQLGQQVNTTYYQFYKIGQEIISLQDEQHSLLQPLREKVDDIMANFEELAQLQIDVGYTESTGGVHPLAALHLSSLFEMLEIVAELHIQIEGLIQKHVASVKVRALQVSIYAYSDVFHNAYMGYKGTTFSLDEAGILDQAYNNFLDILVISEELLEKTVELNDLLEEFDGYLEEIDGVMDDQIKPLVNEATETATQEALTSSRLALGTTWIYSFFGLALMGTLLIGVNRWVIQPIHVLIGGIEKFAAGSLGEKIEIKSDDEIGQLATAFNDMTIQIDDKITTIRNNELELEQLNVNLEAEMKKRIEYEQEMLRVARENEVDRVRSRFLSTITHELRTPLTSIKGYIDIIRSGFAGEVPGEIDELLEVVTRNTDRLSTLTNDLLDIQRIETGRLEVDLTPIDLREVLASCTQEIKPFLDEKNQTLHTRISDNPIMVQGDQVRLSQVVMNILNNASKFSPEEETISLEATLEGEEVRVSISDKGIGIKEEDLERVFEPLAMIEKPIYVKGTGLGLSVSKGIIELHGGKIWAESEGEWKGATLIITLPLWRE